MKKIDINDTVTVILTDFGIKVLNNYREHLEKQLQKDNLTLKVSLKSMYCCDENGRYSTELWQLMFIFGQDISSEQIFLHNNIYIE